MAVAELAKGNENYDPLATSQDVFARQASTKPPREKHVFSLTFNGEKQNPIVAADDNEAWAIFCDGRKQYPSRRRSNVQIVDLGTVSKVQAARDTAQEAKLAAGKAERAKSDQQSSAGGDIAGELAGLEA